jgi:hypothetical protein
MTVTRVSTKNAIKLALLPCPGLPRWKRRLLRNPDRDKAQKKAYYSRKRDKIAVNSRVRYLKIRKANPGDLNER